MDKHVITLIGKSQRAYAAEKLAAAGDGYVVTISEPTRSLDQNAKLWPMLQDVSRQVIWHTATLSPDEWKDVFTAALKRSKVVPGLDGGFVVLGQRTSTMSKALFSELVELIYAFGAERGVIWSEPVAVGAA